jgi:hypothetical protein
MENDKEQNNKKNEYKFKFCKWTTLRSFGDSYILKVSYFSLAAVPFIAKNLTKLGVEDFPIYLKLLFFSSLLISIGNLFYSVFCPKLIKKFESPNEMYRANLEIYKLRKITNISDDFEGDHAHSVNGFKNNNFKASGARFICFCCLLLGGLFAFAFILERTYWVWKA